MRGQALSWREREVLALTCRDGLDVKATAAVLGVAPKTIGNHRASLLDKLGERSMIAACAHLRRQGGHDAGLDLDRLNRARRFVESLSPEMRAAVRDLARTIDWAEHGGA